MADALRRLPIRKFGALPYLWLVYSLGVPVSLIGAPPQLVAFQLPVFAVFLILYVLAFGRWGPPALAYAGAIGLLGAIASPSDGLATSYFIFGATFIGWGVRAPLAYRLLALYVALVGLDVWLTHVVLISGAIGVVISLVLGLACISTAEQRRAHVRLQQAYLENERLAKIAERERIGRDLHDVLGHTLSLIALKSQLASKLAERDPARAAEEIRAVERIARTSLDELRAAVAGYRAVGIQEELAHAREVLGSAGLRVQCEAEDVVLAPATESVLALAIREAVTNIVRHAHAGAVALRLTGGEGRCRFEIADDGVGGTAPEGLGLSGMRERVESHGGSVERTSERGTRLVVVLPLAAETAR